MTNKQTKTIIGALWLIYAFTAAFLGIFLKDNKNSSKIWSIYGIFALVLILISYFIYNY